MVQTVFQSSTSLPIGFNDSSTSKHSWFPPHVPLNFHYFNYKIYFKYKYRKKFQVYL